MMKTTQTFLKLILVLSLATGIQSCKKSDSDTQAPSLVVLSPNSGDQFSSGSDITVIATFHDYIELGKYRLVIRWNTDAQNVSPNPEASSWEYLLEVPLSGKNEAINKKITVPENIRLGKYDMILYCLDKAGNETFKTDTIGLAN
jgi:hypothetical protein